jgi:predicted dehydrogenase
VQAAAALEAGLHVLVEKPLAVSSREARRIVELERQTGKVVLVPYGWNFRPFLAAAHRFVFEGRLGTIRHISASMASPTTDLMTGQQVRGTEKEMFRPNSSAWADPRTGGYGWGQLVHVLGAVFYLSGLEPQAVFAITGQSTQGADLYDAVSIRLSNGATVALSGSATVPFGSAYQMDIRIFGTEGMLLVDVEEGRERVWLRLNDGTSETIAVAPGEGAYVCEEPVRRFIDLIVGKSTDNPGSASIGSRAVEVVDAMHRSSESGVLVGVNDPA